MIARSLARGAQLQSLLIARGAAPPIILMTAFPDEVARAHALDAGAVGYLSKPFEEDRLIDCLKVAVGDAAGESFGS
jgi:FixJ family two-component response regulator